MCESQTTNRKQGGLPLGAPSPLLYSYWSPMSHIWLPAGWNTQKYHHKQVEALTFWLTNRLKQLFKIKLLTGYYSKTFSEEFIRPILSYFCLKFWESHMSPAIQTRVNVLLTIKVREVLFVRGQNIWWVVLRETKNNITHSKNHRYIGIVMSLYTTLNLGVKKVLAPSKNLSKWPIACFAGEN
jgi:hypothetical protein